MSLFQLQQSNKIKSFKAVAIDNIFNGLPIGPVIEPEHNDAIFTGKSHELLRTGTFNKVPVIIGLNSNEAKSFLGLFIGFYDSSTGSIITI